ncbi:MAG: DUF2953 domain-containing protein [Methanoregula sp.]
MDTVYLLAFIPVCVLCALLGIALLLYAVPLRFFVQYTGTEDRKETMAAVSWNRLSICLKTAADRRELVILAAGHVLISQNLHLPPPSPPPKNQQKSPRPENEEIRTAEDLIPLIWHLIEPVKKIGLVLYRESAFENVRGTVRIGLGDPAATGMLYGGFWATRFVFSASHIYLDLTPDFNRKILEMELSVRFRINRPLRILVAGIQVVRTPGAREFISNLHVKKRVAQ